MVCGSPNNTGMEQITANLSGKARRIKRDGREFIVVPASLIVPGVLNGSQGPLFYPLDEISKGFRAWDNMPIVVYHPMRDGNPITARDPDILDKHGIGAVFNTTVNGKLGALLHFDVEKTRRVASSILADLEAGRPIELSTGLRTDNEIAPEGSEFNGVKYTHIARNYRPDHLAILPDGKGACSVADGCGVLVNERNEFLINSTAVLKGFTGHAGFLGAADHHQHVATVDADSGKGITNRVGGHLHFVNRWAVSSEEGHSHSLERTHLIDTGVRNKSTSNLKESTMDEKQKKALIDGLIANTCCWNDDEADRKVLNEFSDEKLEKLVTNAKKAAEEVTANEAKTKAAVTELEKTHTLDEKTGAWVVNEEGGHGDKKGGKGKKVGDDPTKTKQLTREDVLTNEDIENLEFARAEKQRQKEVLVEQLTANVSDTDKPEQIRRLMSRSLEDLKGDVALLPAAPKKTTQNYDGSPGGPPPATTANQEAFAPFGLPGENGYHPAGKPEAEKASA